MTGRLRFARTFSGALGLTIVFVVVFVALLGNYFAPHDPDRAGRRSAGRAHRAMPGLAPMCSAVTCSAACSTAAAR